MSRTVVNARLLLLGLLLTWAGWMLTTGLLLARPAASAWRLGGEGALSAGVTILMTLAAWAVLYSRLPEAARAARAWPVRVVGNAAALGAAGLALGLSAQFPQTLAGRLIGEVPADGVLMLRGAIGALGFLLVLFVPAGRDAPAPFFLTAHGHASDEVARRSLPAAAGHALLLTLAVDLALHFPAEPADPLGFPRMLWNGALSYLVGILLAHAQRYPQRAAGLLPCAGFVAVIALFAAWIAPSAEWPVLLLAAALGLTHTPPRNDLLASLPASQRLAGLALMALAQAAGVAAGLTVVSALSSEEIARPVRFLVALILATLAVWFYLRELTESFIELILMVTNPIRAYGPGQKILPTRGPVLVVANHCAWFDPLWLAKVIPMRMRPMMTSRFYDKPGIHWLMRRVFHAIRVPDVGFRREAPEIHEAIAALDRGENVLIFPEGWLKRREEQSLRRFGQGVYQILRDKPQTPVVVCWIEGGWGSYASYWKGPPTVNKKPDFLHRIEIGISEPQVLSLELLHDPWATRRHLMLACLRARTYLGLPELPPPPFAMGDEEGEEGPAPSAEG